YAFHEAGTVDPEAVFKKAVVAPDVRVADDLSPAREVAQLSLADWQRRLAPTLAAAAKADGQKPSFSPGSIVANLRYGNANLDANVNILDALDVANTSVGNNPLINGTDAPSRDRVVAANVFPANLPGLGEATDATP